MKEYLILDRFVKRVTVFRRNRGRFVEHGLGSEEVYTTPLLPGLMVPLAEILDNG